MTANTPAAVTLANFRRAETDLYLRKFVENGAFGQFLHVPYLTSIEKQDVVRMNRDALYSYAVADLSLGPVTVTLPEAGGRFMALQVIDQDHYTPAVVYTPGSHCFSLADVGTRYALLLVRTFVDPGSEADFALAHALQAQVLLQQPRGADFVIPAWDTLATGRIRAALNDLAAAAGGMDSAQMFGARGEVDDVQHLIGTALGWGGNPARDAFYVNVHPPGNDGVTPHVLRVHEVPVDGFWSISVYNREGYFEKNDRDAYSINNVSAQCDDDGGVTVYFGGCEQAPGNCLPITPGWNYVVRLYRPRAQVLDGRWVFPTARPVKQGVRA
ncbi:DUF1254 domain-containing protein [Mangrovimicrobium sediminis]|nr:DUF1254 domain-containing protein [Haliea sp. SAOS-164]